MVNTNDVLRLTDHQYQEDQQVLNVYFYRAKAIIGNVAAIDLITIWRTIVLTAVLKIQHSDLYHYKQIVDNLTDPLEFAEFGEIINGEVITGEAAPVFNAIGYDLLRTTKATRKGSKRFGGVPDDLIIGSVIDSDYTAFGLLQTALALDLDFEGIPPADAIFEPVIVGRLPDGHYDLTRISVVSGAQARLPVTSQVSRKIGVGS